MKDKKYNNEVMEKLNLGMAVVEERYATIAAKHNVTYNELMIIYILMENDNITQMDICQAMHLPKSTVHSIVVSMQKDNFIALNDGRNKKEKYVTVTDKGKKRFQSIFNDVRQMEINMIDAIPEDDLDHLMRIVDKVVALDSHE